MSNVNPETLDSAAGTSAKAKATTVAAAVIAATVGCGFFSVISGAFAFLSSNTAYSVNQNFADTALRFDLQDLHRQRARLEDKLDTAQRFEETALRFDLQAQETARRFDSLERMIKNLKGVQAVEPPVEPPVKPLMKPQPVDIESISTQIKEIDSKIKAKEYELKRINGSKEGGYEVYNRS
jgi:hypothetical protein